MPKFRRTDRINEQFKQEISMIIRDEVRDPRVGLATITAVQTSPELDHAKVYFTALGSDEERAEMAVCVVSEDRRHAQSVLSSADRMVAEEGRARIIDSYTTFY